MAQSESLARMSKVMRRIEDALAQVKNLPPSQQKLVREWVEQEYLNGTDPEPSQ